MRQAVILVGGKGTRLGELTGDRPKPFLDIEGIPFIDVLIGHAKCQGIEEVILLAGHRADWIQQHYCSTVSEMNIKVCVETAPMGTAGALLSAIDHLDDCFLLLNGDSILSGNWSSLFPLLNDGSAIALATRAVKDTSRYGKISVDGGTVVRFAEKADTGPGEINSGIYAVRREAVLPHVQGPTSLEMDILPKLVGEGKVRAAMLGGYFIDIGLPETLNMARDELVEGLRVPAVVFDRDNTLVEDKGYTHKVSDLRWKDGAVETIKRFNDMGYKVFVATNQSGIARGYYEPSDMKQFHKAMQSDLHNVGAHIDGFYHCPHHPDGVVAGLTKVCECRKPATGMLAAMFEDHVLDKEQSFMVGDMEKDVNCGEAFGLSSFLYKSGSLFDFCRERGLFNDHD